MLEIEISDERHIQETSRCSEFQLDLNELMPSLRMAVVLGLQETGRLGRLEV